MFRHVVLLSWNQDVTLADVARLEAELASLPSLVPQIRDYRFGRDAGLVQGNADFAVVADFDDEAGYRTFLDHPAHVPVRDRARAMAARRTAIQFAM